MPLCMGRRIVEISLVEYLTELCRAGWLSIEAVMRLKSEGKL
jgi:hypothetical protein